MERSRFTLLQRCTQRLCAVSLLLWLMVLPASPAVAAPGLRYGVHTITGGPAELTQAYAAGFDTVVQLLNWGEIEPARGQFFWQRPDELVQAAQAYGLDLVLRLDHPPAWARPTPLTPGDPPVRLTEYRQWVERVVRRYQGQVHGYIIWNEPNLALEWAGLPPDPAAYVQLLAVGYRAVKAVDPTALVISAGLAPTNTQNADALDERLYLEAMYAVGAAPFFDRLGAHAYGFGLPPSDEAGWPGGLAGLNLQRVAATRAIMERSGDGDKAVWITELGWSVEGVAHAGGHGVTPAQQADYLAEALTTTLAPWPWVELVTVWNIGDRSTTEWRSYSLLDAQGLPRPALARLTNLLTPTAATRRSQPTRTMQRQILAADTTIHLGDARLPAPWVELHLNRNPSPVWEGNFYLTDPGEGNWMLTVSMMQSNYWSNRIWINDQPLPTPMPVSDFTKSWVAYRWPVPATQLRPGHNTIRVTITHAVGLIQDRRFSYDKVQLKDMLLRRVE